VATDKMVVHAKDLIKWINEAAQNSLKNLEKNISCHKCKTINTGMLYFYVSRADKLYRISKHCLA